MQKATLKMIKTRAGPCAVGDAEGARSLPRWVVRKRTGAFRGGVRTLVCLPAVTKISAIRPYVASGAPIVSCRDAIRFVQSGRVILLPELSRRHRLLVLVICSSSLFIVGLDSTIVNIALPAIGRDLHASVAGLQWTVDGYALVLASLLMLSGATADRIGRRRVFQVGLATFTAGSALCSLAPSLGWLVAFRMLQAIGGSMLNPVAMSIITNTFTDKTERARAIGVWGGAYGLSMSLGPVIGGLLVDSIGWRGTFYVNIPIGLAAIALTARFVPESRARRPRRPDPVGQALIIVMLGSLTYAIIEGPAFDWRGLGHRLHQPADRPVSRHRRRRLDPGREPGRPAAPGWVRSGQPRRLAIAGCDGRGGLRARSGHHQPVGAGHGGPHRGHVRYRRFRHSRAASLRAATAAVRRSSAGPLGR